MASYHLTVKSVSRSTGRSATAAAAYRSAEKIACEREGRVHDYTRKRGVAHTEIVAPPDAPDWMRDRQTLWNGVEAAENRKNSVVAREWELALPHELDADARSELVIDFAHELVERYGVVADVSIHLPHRDGDQRNHHAHVLTTTRRVAEDGFGAKTRELDVKQKSSIEIATMRELWAERQNKALERSGEKERVDHRSLEVQRMDAKAERDRLTEILAKRDHENAQDRDWETTERDHAIAAFNTAALDRSPEINLGPVTSAVERKAEKAAETASRPYQPVTDRGAEVHALREQKSLIRDAAETLKEIRGNVAEAAREVFGWIRETLWDRERGEKQVRVEGLQERLDRLRDGATAERRDQSDKDTGMRLGNEDPEREDQFRPIQRDENGRVAEDMRAYLDEAERWRKQQRQRDEQNRERDEDDRQFER